MDQDKGLEQSDSRARIMDEAKVLFAARGYRGLSMREIAEAVGISKAGIYYHFRDKEALFSAIAHRYLDALSEMIDSSEQAHSSARRQVEQVVRLILQQPAEDRTLVRLANQEMALLSEPARSQFSAAYREKFVGRVRALIAKGMASGELRRLDPETATWALLGMMYPYFTPTDPTLGRFPPESVIDVLLCIFFDGMGLDDQTTE